MKHRGRLDQIVATTTGEREVHVSFVLTVPATATNDDIEEVVTELVDDAKGTTRIPFLDMVGVEVHDVSPRQEAELRRHRAACVCNENPALPGCNLLTGECAWCEK